MEHVSARINKILSRFMKRYSGHWYGQLWHFNNPRARELWSRFAKRLGLTYRETFKSLWDAHHVDAVKDGGGACGLDGFATICVWCHKIKTAKQRERWAK
jgi:hypothetical protein